MLAHPARGRRQRIVHDDGEKRVLQPVLFVQLQEPRNVHVQRATVFAGRKRQFFAHAGLAAPRHDVVLELVTEMPQRGQYRIGRGLAQSAQRAIANVAAEFVEEVEVLRRARAFGDAVQNAQRFVQSNAAGNALAAGFGVGEFDEVTRHVHHAVVFIHHHHAAGTHDGAQLRQAFVIHRRIEHLLRDAAARGPAGLHGFDLVGHRRRLRQCRR